MKAEQASKTSTTHLNCPNHFMNDKHFFQKFKMFCFKIWNKFLIWILETKIIVFNYNIFFIHTYNDFKNYMRGIKRIPHNNIMPNYTSAELSDLDIEKMYEILKDGR